MLECERLGVEPRPPGIPRHSSPGSVDGITDDRMIDGTHVNPDLMGTSGFERDRHERFVLIIPIGEAPVVGSSVASSLGNGHSRGMGVIAPNRGVDRAVGVGEPSCHQGEIAPIDFTLLQRRLQVVERGRCLRDDEEPRRVSIDPVHDPPPMLRAKIGNCGDAGQESVRERSTRAPCSRVYDHSCGLVNDDHVIVLVRDGELDVDVRFHGNFVDDEVDLDHITGYGPIRRREAVSPSHNATCLDR